MFSTDAGSHADDSIADSPPDSITDSTTDEVFADAEEAGRGLTGDGLAGDSVQGGGRVGDGTQGGGSAGDYVYGGGSAGDGAPSGGWAGDDTQGGGSAGDNAYGGGSAGDGAQGAGWGGDDAQGGGSAGDYTYGGGSAGDGAQGAGWGGDDAQGGRSAGDYSYDSGSAGDYPQGGGDEPFFGMQSEAAVVTGVALGPGLRRGALVCVGALVGLGVLFWAGLAVFYVYRVFFDSAHVNPDMPRLPDGRPWTAFYLVGAVWAIGVGLFGLVSRWHPRLLVWCFACLVTAFFWPAGMAASAIAVAWRRRDLAASRRLALALLAVLVAIGGPVWRFAAPSSTAEPASVASDGDLLGTWHSRSGMSVALHGDGTYTAGTLSGGGLGAGDGVPASAGTWDSESPGGHSGVRLQIDGDLSHSVWFDVYKAGPDLVLCASDDPGNPCQVVLRRS
ncbi:hypothetical protein [Catenulispora rubra]|uniref:hypothetical protein n=1 Tax=Catenulispora rubra TaxID=280293 RepID=UPI0018923752|nr:hypothetical protein [Catenulispora rubra]